MKYLIIGLGNMGHEYDDTRHNIGFKVVDAVAKKFEVSYKHEHLGDLAAFKNRGRQIYLLKPSTYMNLSGKAIRYWVQKLGIKTEQWLVVVDEIQFELGTVRMQKKGNAGGHNGLQSIQDLMQTSTYPRLRIGIGRNFHPGGQIDYVLGKWTEKENEILPAVEKKAAEMIISFGVIGLDRTMTQFNKRK